MNDPETQLIIFDPYVLLGILANCKACGSSCASLLTIFVCLDNKFEFQNPYQLRLADFVNDTTIKKIIKEIGTTSYQARTEYIAIQEDLPESWLGGVLSYVGLGAMSGVQKPKTPPPPSSPEAIKLAFEKLFVLML